MAREKSRMAAAGRFKASCALPRPLNGAAFAGISVTALV